MDHPDRWVSMGFSRLVSEDQPKNHRSPAEEDHLPNDFGGKRFGGPRVFNGETARLIGMRCIMMHIRMTYDEL